MHLKSREKSKLSWYDVYASFRLGLLNGLPEDGRIVEVLDICDGLKERESLSFKSAAWDRRDVMSNWVAVQEILSSDNKSRSPWLTEYATKAGEFDTADMLALAWNDFERQCMILLCAHVFEVVESRRSGKLSSMNNETREAYFDLRDILEAQCAARGWYVGWEFNRNSVLPHDFLHTRHPVNNLDELVRWLGEATGAMLQKVAYVRLNYVDQVDPLFERCKAAVELMTPFKERSSNKNQILNDSDKSKFRKMVIDHQILEAEAAKMAREIEKERLAQERSTVTATRRAGPKGPF